MCPLLFAVQLIVVACSLVDAVNGSGCCNVLTREQDADMFLHRLQVIEI